MTLRRCLDEREDFTAEDGSIFPIQITKGGGLYGFCPAKVTWDQQLVSIYRILVLCSETNQMPNGKPILEQDPEFLDLIGWFIPTYKSLRFAQNAQILLGKPDTGRAPSSGNNGRVTSKSKR